MAGDVFEQVAAQYEAAAAELELAMRHLRTAAQHFRERNVPRGCAHAFAAQGHLFNAEHTIKDLAILHASRSNPEPAP
jgi:hypothetical protein